MKAKGNKREREILVVPAVVIVFSPARAGLRHSLVLSVILLNIEFPIPNFAGIVLEET
jgi:hypothetical protein